MPYVVSVFRGCEQITFNAETAEAAEKKCLPDTVRERYVENPDEHFTRGKAAGAIVVADPQDTPFGARFYAVRDPERFLWWLSTYKPNSTARSAQPHI